MAIPVKKMIPGVGIVLQDCPKACLRTKLSEGWTLANGDDVKLHGLTRTLKGYDKSDAISISDPQSTNRKVLETGGSGSGLKTLDPGGVTMTSGAGEDSKVAGDAGKGLGAPAGEDGKGQSS